MCEDCYNRAGRPTETADTTPRALVLLGELFGQHSTGGPLHVVVDDWNLDDDSLRHAREDLDDEDWADDRDVCLELLDLLDAMTLTQRYGTMARFDGFA